MADITVSLCCNDEHGYNQGFAELVEFERDGATIELGPSAEFPSCHIDRQRDVLTIDRHEYPFVSYRSHVGNLCWDEVTLSERDARKLFERLRKAGFVVESCDDGAPFSEVAE